MDSAPGEEVFFSGHPSWLARPAFLARRLALSLVLGVAAGIASVIAAGREQTSWVILAVLAVFLLTLARIQLRRLRVTYRITNRRLTIETGLFARRVLQARLEHVQNVSCRQTLLQRAVGVGTVHFETAGEVGYNLAFRGVDNPRRLVRMVDQALLPQGEDAWEAYLAAVRP